VSACTSIWQVAALYATLVPVGMVTAGLFPAQALAIRWFREQKGFAIGLVSMGPGLGGLVLPQVVARLIETLGWRETHLVLAALVVAVVAPLGYLIVRDPPGESAAAPVPGHGPAAVSDVTIGSILGARSYWAIAIAFTAIYISYFAFM